MQENGEIWKIDAIYGTAVHRASSIIIAINRRLPAVVATVAMASIEKRREVECFLLSVNQLFPRNIHRPKGDFK